MSEQGLLGLRKAPLEQADDQVVVQVGPDLARAAPYELLMQMTDRIRDLETDDASAAMFEFDIRAVCHEQLKTTFVWSAQNG